MKSRLVMVLAITVLECWPSVVRGDILSVVSPSSIPVVLEMKGEVLKIEGENFVMQDDSGKELLLRLGDKASGSPKVGDKVEAQVLADTGMTLSLKTVPEQGTLPASGAKDVPR